MLAALAVLVAPVAAGAATTLYWVQEGSSPGLFSGALGGTPNTLFGATEAPESEGIALDSMTDSVYWTGAGGADIFSGSLEGGGGSRALFEGREGVVGLAVDATTHKLYWSELEGGRLSVGGLGGASEGPPTTLIEGEDEPAGIALDAATGQLFWVDGGGNVMVGKLSDGGTSLSEHRALYENQEILGGIAVNETTGKLYWTAGPSNGTGEILSGGLAGEPEELPEAIYTEPQSGTIPYGLAIDPHTQRIYWTDYETGGIQVHSLSKSGEAATVFPTAAEGPNLLALLGAPVAAGAPSVSGNTIGKPLTCSTGSWEPDLPQSQFYEAPQAFAYQWLREGTPIAGANAASFTPSEAGSYACEVTATNAAGSATQTSASTVVPVLTAIPVPEPLAKIKEVQIMSHRLVVKAGKVRVVIACGKGAGGSCKGTLSLVTEFNHSVPKGHGKKQSKHSLPAMTLAHAVPYELASGKRKTIVLKIDAEGKRLLKKAKGHKLKVWALATFAVGGRAGQGVTLSLPKPHKR
jgi:hypothetical protein